MYSVEGLVVRKMNSFPASYTLDERAAFHLFSFSAYKGINILLARADKKKLFGLLESSELFFKT